MSPEEYYPIPPTKIQKAVICTPEEVQMWKDENLKLKTRIAELEADLKQEEHNSEAFMNKIGEQACYIVDLENQIKALKDIAIYERMWFNIAIGKPADARRQLAEEHPEAFR